MSAASPAVVAPTGRRSNGPGTTLLAVVVAQFMVTLDLSVVNVGLPQIARGLGFGTSGLTWVINAYALTFGGLLLLGGKAADLYGRRRMLLSGLALFGVACLLGGFAQQPGQLIATRAVQGVGAAALAPAALALMSATFPSGRARIRAFGAWSATNAAGGALGVVIGGLLTQYAGWRWVMFINVPMALVGLLLVWRRVASDAPPAGPGRPDVLGAALGTAGMGTMVFGIVRTTTYPWGSATTVTTLTVAVALLVAFVLVERSTARDALIRMSLLAHRSVAGANAYNLLAGAALTASFYFISLYMQRVLGVGAALTGVEMLPFAVGVIVGSVLAIKLGYRLPRRTLLIAGGLTAAAGFFWFGLIGADGAFVSDVLGPSIVASTGFGLCLAPLVSTATAGVAAEQAGMASGLLNASRQIGASLGLAVLGTAAAHRTGALGTPAALTSGYAFGMVLGGVLLLGAVLIAVTVLRGVESRPAEGGGPAKRGMAR